MAPGPVLAPLAALDRSASRGEVCHFHPPDLRNIHPPLTFGIWDVAIGVVIAVAVVWAFRRGGWSMLWLASFGSLALVEAAVLASWAGGAREGNRIVTMAAAAIPVLVMTFSVPALARMTSKPLLQVIGVLIGGAVALIVAAVVALAGFGL